MILIEAHPTVQKRTQSVQTTCALVVTSGRSNLYLFMPAVRQDLVAHRRFQRMLTSIIYSDHRYGHDQTQDDVGGVSAVAILTENRACNELSTCLISPSFFGKRLAAVASATRAGRD